MPDDSGRIVPTFYSLSDERWESIFGKPEEEVEIVWTPDPSLDGASFDADR